MKWAQQKEAQHPPFAQMEGYDSPMQELPLNVPLAQSRSFHTGQTLVQGLPLRQVSSLSQAVPLSKLHTLVDCFLMYMIESCYGITAAMSPSPDPHRLPAEKSGVIHPRSDGVQERDSKCKGPGVEHGWFQESHQKRAHRWDGGLR